MESCIRQCTSLICLSIVNPLLIRTTVTCKKLPSFKPNHCHFCSTCHIVTNDWKYHCIFKSSIKKSSFHYQCVYILKLDVYYKSFINVRKNVETFFSSYKRWVFDLKCSWGICIQACLNAKLINLPCLTLFWFSVHYNKMLQQQRECWNIFLIHHTQGASFTWNVQGAYASKFV